MDVDEISGEIVDSAMDVHSELGPGLLESAYQSCLAYELKQREIPLKSQVHLPVDYKGHQLDPGYRLDLLVDDSVIVELKAVTELQPIHEAQLLSYLKLSDLTVGLLINFHVERLKDGINRLVN